MKPAISCNATCDDPADKAGGSRRWKMLALIAPGLIAIEAAPAPWTVEIGTAFVRPRLTRSIPGFGHLRTGRLVQAEPARIDHFSTKARSIT